MFLHHKYVKMFFLGFFFKIALICQMKPLTTLLLIKHIWNLGFSLSGDDTD